METRGVRNNNPLNIRKGNNWQGEHPTKTDTYFEVFARPEYGFRAAFRIMRNGFKANPPRNTIRDIISRWAPPQDNNDTEKYIQFVSHSIDKSQEEVLTYEDETTMCKLAQAMAVMESAKMYDMEIIKRGYQLERER